MWWQKISKSVRKRRCGMAFILITSFMLILNYLILYEKLKNEMYHTTIETNSNSIKLKEIRFRNDDIISLGHPKSG
jgi:hypothetical protein